jgi:hypothetical protein
MKFKVLKAAIAVMLIAISTASSASLVIGSLKLEVGDNHVSDSLNNLEWLRWDQVKSLNYSQLLTQLSAGRDWDGWNIADNDYANKFVNATLGDIRSCTSLTLNEVCASSFDHSQFKRVMGFGSSPSRNFAFFLSPSTSAEVGNLQSNFDTGLIKQNRWSSIAVSDDYSEGGSRADAQIGFMLYRDAVQVNAPATLAIFALGMIGLASRRFKKQS